MPSSLTLSQLAALAKLGTPAVCNAIETFRLRLRNEGYIAHPIRRRTAPPRSMVGYALTIRMRTATPPMEGLSYIENTEWWKWLAAAPKPTIIVIHDLDESPGVGAVSGETHAAVFRAFDSIGIVTNGAVRDLDALGGMNMHVYSGSVSPSHAYAHIVEVGAPVEIAGTIIETGDLLHGDGDGIVNIPPQIAAEIPHVADEMTARERKIISLCATPGFSVDELRKMITSYVTDEIKGT
jgi:4-hydroxy-4-methyl-2-oxoglutarate aldolase